MTDLDEAKAILAVREAELNKRFKGRDGFPRAFFSLKGGGYAKYDTLCNNGIVQEGGHIWREPTAVIAARRWVEQTRIYDDPELSGILYWRRRPEVAYYAMRQQTQNAPDADWSEMFLVEKGWLVSARLVIVDGEPELEPEDTMPEDYPGWAEMVSKYLEGVPK